jgi:hypothetical protein
LWFSVSCDVQEQLRVLKEVKELAGVTFRPDLSPSRQRAGESFVVRACAGVPRGKARLWLVICMLCKHARAYNHYPSGFSHNSRQRINSKLVCFLGLLRLDVSWLCVLSAAVLCSPRLFLPRSA